MIAGSILQRAQQAVEVAISVHRIRFGGIAVGSDWMDLNQFNCQFWQIVGLKRR